MNRIILIAGLVTMVCLCGASSAYSQKATEVYIPIGDSPGVSSTGRLLGTVSRMDYESNTIQVRTRDGTKTVVVNDKTLYFLDRSKKRKQNEMGEFEDCKAGRNIEIYVDDDGQVMWIKIETE